MGGPAPTSIPAPTPIPPPTNLPPDAFTPIPGVTFQDPPSLLTPTQPQAPSEYVPPPIPGYGTLTPFDASPNPARSLNPFEEYLRNHSIQPDGQLGWAPQSHPRDLAVMPPRDLAPPTGDLLTPSGGNDMAEYTPHDLSDPIDSMEWPRQPETATPSVLTPGRTRRQVARSDRIPSDYTPHELDAPIGEPLEDKWKPDWRSAFLMMNAVRQPPPVGTGIPAGLPVMPEPARPAPPWQPAAGFRQAFRSPPPPMGLGSFLERGRG